MTRFNFCFSYRLGSMLASAASQSDTHSKPCCKLAENGHSTGVVSTGFCFVGFHVGFQLPGYVRGHHGRRYRGDPCWVPCLGEVTMGKALWGVHVGFCWVPLRSMLVQGTGGSHGKGTVGVHVGFHAGFQRMGEVTVGEGTMVPCWLPASSVWERSPTVGFHVVFHVGFHVGLHVGFHLSGYGRGYDGKGTVGVHVGFHVGFQLPVYGRGHVGFHVGFQLSGMGEVTMGKVPCRSMLVSMQGPCFIVSWRLLFFEKVS